ncbi:MAG: hypothetical protein IKN73_00100 [Alphaproteobacteria bacterium]|nr:hypothetical protein [Alphaproteobacteria bacterium]
MRLFILILLSLSLTACNTAYIKPNTLDTKAMIYTQRGGYSMQRTIKETMEKRGYTVSTGKLKRVSEIGDKEIYEITEDSKYAVKVSERKETLRPIWCVFNGFWWWNFNVSIIDRTNNDEILSWRGRGCANSSIKRLNRILDQMEIKTEKSE